MKNGAGGFRILDFPNSFIPTFKISKNFWGGFTVILGDTEGAG